ncbi:MAG: hypothetical protein ACRDSP_00165 [Pseudonocardiaceae bacterium]
MKLAIVGIEDATRITEIRALPDTPALAQAEGVTATPGAISTADVYQSWAPATA